MAAAVWCYELKGWFSTPMHDLWDPWDASLPKIGSRTWDQCHLVPNFHDWV